MLQLFSKKIINTSKKIFTEGNMEFAGALISVTILGLWFMYWYTSIKSLVCILKGIAFDEVMNLEWEVRIAFGLVLMMGLAWVIKIVSFTSWLVWIILFVLGLRSLKKHKT